MPREFGRKNFHFIVSIQNELTTPLNCGGCGRFQSREARPIGAAVFLDGNERFAAALLLEDEIVGVEPVTLGPPLAIGRKLRVDALADSIRKIELACDEILVVEDHLEMDMRRAARIPAGINGGEVHSTFSISELS